MALAWVFSEVLLLCSARRCGLSCKYTPRGTTPSLQREGGAWVSTPTARALDGVVSPALPSPSGERATVRVVNAMNGPAQTSAISAQTLTPNPSLKGRGDRCASQTARSGAKI